MPKRFAFLVLCVVPLWIPTLASAQTDVRVATWNIESVGAPGSSEYSASLDVLARIAADVVALNEIAQRGRYAQLGSAGLGCGLCHFRDEQRCRLRK